MDIILSRIVSLIPSKRGSKKELADAVGIPANLISEWEKGRNKSYPKYLPQIADYYGVSLDWLSGRSEQKENPPAASSEGKYPEKYNLLNETNKAIVDRLIADLAKSQSNQ